MITEIKISKLRIHPKNVRKVYNNIDELADSIKAQGILQNLTVVNNPEEEGTYWVVIGNRRLTAAIQAGIETAPCQIVEMDEKEQAQTMLLENMQRSDLTIYEQSQGIQMVLDLGETEDGLSDKTGLSKTTIRHRVNIAKLNPEILKSKEQDDAFQLTLKDLYELEKIPNVKMRDKILKEATDSNNLAIRAKNAYMEVKRKENEKKYVAMFKKMGIKPAPENAKNEMYSNKWDTVKQWNLDKEVPKKINLGKEDAEKCYYIEYWRDMKIIKKRIKVKCELTEREKELKEQEKRKRQLKAIQKEMAAEREDFIHLAIERNFSPDKMDSMEVYSRLFSLMLGCDCWMNISEAHKFLSGSEETWKLSNEQKEELNTKFKGLKLYYQFFIYANEAVNDKDVSEWNATYHKKNGKLLMEYEEILKDFGFSYSEEEYEQISVGTHPLYSK